jgi:hypothetical protein
VVILLRSAKSCKYQLIRIEQQHSVQTHVAIVVFQGLRDFVAVANHIVRLVRGWNEQTASWGRSRLGRQSNADRIDSSHTVCLVCPEVRLTIGGHSRVPSEELRQGDKVLIRNAGTVVVSTDRVPFYTICR